MIKRDVTHIISIKLSDGTGAVDYVFPTRKVFYGAKQLYEDGTLGISGDELCAVDANDAVYTSSDETILSFDNEAKTCTFHGAGLVYVTITYNNSVERTKETTPTVTTTFSLEVLDQ